jgi:protein-tyrosine phosphatase
MVRDIAWNGFYNARDLGGLPTRDGRVTRHGSLIRSADLCFVTEDGWRAAYEAGVRTVLDLRNDDEVASAPPVPAHIARVRVALDGSDDTELWNYIPAEKINGTPLYYRPFLRRRAERRGRRPARRCSTCWTASTPRSTCWRPAPTRTT